MNANRVRIRREVRFGLHEEGVGQLAATMQNGFAGNPALVGMGPFLTLAACMVGNVDRRTGMVMNIKVIDRILRAVAVPLTRKYFYSGDERGRGAVTGGGDLVLNVREVVAAELAAYGDGDVELEAVELGLSPFLRLTACAKEQTVVEMTERFEFSAAHRLHSADLSEAENKEIFGKCDNPHGHGHNYEVDVTVAGEPDAQTGLVLAVGELQRIVNARVIDVLDHKHLNLDCAEFRELNPTVENISRVVYEKLSGSFGGRVTLRRVRVWETPKTWSEYPAGD